MCCEKSKRVVLFFCLSFQKIKNNIEKSDMITQIFKVNEIRIRIEKRKIKYDRKREPERIKK